MSKRLIYAEDAIDAMKDMYHAAEKWGAEATDDIIKARAESCMATLVEMKLRTEKLPSAQPDEQCDNCHYKHIWMTQRMNGNGFFGHGGATG